MGRFREADLLQPIARYVHRKGYRWQALELPFYEYRIDLYGFCADTGTTLAVELKLARWKRALEQALVYQLCSDLVFVALPKKRIPKIPMQLFRDSGIGLISVGDDGTCRVELQAQLSFEVREHYRGDYIEMLRGENGGRRQSARSR